ncbi:MAG: conserved rane protein of unknown function [Myxococcaceae bacterium]|nr:conserved rane protein of unknown function [Myxococcaceae bacterium]
MSDPVIAQSAGDDYRGARETGGRRSTDHESIKAAPEQPQGHLAREWSWRALARFLKELPVRYGWRTSGAATAHAIDGLRCFAVLIVVLGHLCARLVLLPGAKEMLQPGLWSVLRAFLNQAVGVLVFFVISGFVCAMQLDAHPVRGWGAYAKYLACRLIRIAPPYCAILILSYLGLRMSGHSPQIEVFRAAVTNEEALLVSLLYSYGWYFDGYPKLFVAGLSLEIEIQFYLLAPVLMAAVEGWKHRLAALVTLSFACLILTSTRWGIAPHIHFTFARYCVYFIAGMAGYLAHRRYASSYTHARAARALDWAVLPALAFILGFHQPYEVFWGSPIARHFLITNLSAIGVLLAAALNPHTRTHAILSRRYLSFAGAACYSIYLTHMFVIYACVSFVHPALPGADRGVLALLAVVAAGIATPIVSLVFYVLLQRPFMGKELGDRAISLLQRLGGPQPSTGQSCATSRWVNA